MVWSKEEILAGVETAKYLTQVLTEDTIIVRANYCDTRNISADGYGDMIIFRRVAGGRYFVPVLASCKKSEDKMMTKMGLW